MVTIVISFVSWLQVRPIGFVYIALRWWYYAAIKFHLAWNCNWTCAMYYIRCHWFQVQSNQHQEMKYTPILDHFKDVNSCHPSDLEQIFFNAPGIHFSYLLLSTVKQHFQKTGLDWVFGRKDLQGFNIASASSLWELDILQLQFHHSVWIPVAQCVHTMAFDTYYRRVSYINHREVIYQSGR